METDEFYDSLEDSEYDSLENSLQEDSMGNADIDTDFTLEDDIVPFYDKNLTKSQVELCKKGSKSSTIVNKRNSGRKPKHKKKTAVVVRGKKLNSKSYLDLFYARVGSESTDTVSSRATCLDLSARSFRTCDDGDDLESIFCGNDNNSTSR